MTLTVPLTEPGLGDVRADGVLVGIATADFHLRWTARLLAEAGHRRSGTAGEITCGSLRDLRAELRRRLSEEGPWWIWAPS